jgi:2,5-diketo-D-gluconate reductase B
MQSKELDTGICMEYVTVQGTDVPALGLGTWKLRGAACREAVTHALDMGYRHLDTAQIYGNEADVGEGIRAAGVDREDFFLTTKVWYENRSREATRRTTEESLRRLQTEYVDLLLVHWPAGDLPIEETLDALRALQDAGKARHIGVSNFTPTLLERALAHTPIFCNQVEYHPYLSQARLLAMARRHDLLLTAYSPIAHGQVTRDETLQEIAEAYGKSPVQVTLRWLIQQDHVAAIPKASTAEHREANLGIFDFALSEEEMAHISGLARGERLISPSFAPAWEQ